MRPEWDDQFAETEGERNARLRARRRRKAGQPAINPEDVSISDFAGFSSGVLAEFCRRWPGTNEARAAYAALLHRGALAYAEMCRKPWECIAKGSCPLDPNCAD